MLILRSSSTFTVPKGVKKIDVFCVGGGGGHYEYDVNSKLYIANNGSSSSVGTICYANGGCGVTAGSFDRNEVQIGGNGGSGGGNGNYTVSGSAGNGGSDGSDGEIWSGDKFDISGKGQGTTTRYFGEEDGTLYAGGGGGSGTQTSYVPYISNGGSGGAGGGGIGWTPFVSGLKLSAPANTGGGGGGCNCGGGGGGYTTTKLGVDVEPGQQLSVVVGAGGIGWEPNYNNEYTIIGGSGICIIRWGGYKAT